MICWSTGVGSDEKIALKDHDDNLNKLLQRCEEQHIRLNKEKSVFRATQLPFLGHLITNQGLKPDPEKVSAILEMPPPTDVQGVQRLGGFVNYLAKFLPSLSDVMEPIRQLTKQDVAWHWSEHQQHAFDKVKDMVSQSPLLAYYKPNEELTIQCDASGKGLGAALLQNGRPIAYYSRTLTDAETRYASIEREMLAVVVAFERFHQYTFGRFTRVLSDHKPLEMIVKKSLSKAPKRLQGMLLRLQKYDYDIRYNPGKNMVITDTLSRAFLPADPNEPAMEYEEVNMVSFLPIRDERLELLRKATSEDETLQMLKTTIITGWPDERSKVPEQLTPFFSYRDLLSVQDGLIFKSNSVIVPHSMRTEMMTKIHSSHLGTDGCLRRARECLFWPRMTLDIKQFIAECDVCRSYEKSHQKETLMSHELPSRPWEKVGTDLFHWDDKDYLITVDYYSNFWEVDLLPNTTSDTVITKLKAHFARYGRPNQLISDNGPQYISESFKTFANDYDFEHLCSSPGHSQANGKAESAVKTAKNILTKCKKAGSDPYIAFLDHRNTPSQGLTTSPAQRLMNRRTRTLLPTSSILLKPRVIDETTRMQTKVHKQTELYNRNAKDLKPLDEGETVRMKPLVQGQKSWQKAIVKRRLDERSYVVETQNGIYRRNRVHLRKTQEPPPVLQDQTTARPGQMHQSHNNTTNPSSPKKVKFNASDKSDQNELKQPSKPRPSSPRQTKPNPTEPEPDRPRPSEPPATTTPEETNPGAETVTEQKTTKSGRRIRSPGYLKDYVKS